MSDQLFDGYPDIEPPEKLSADRRRTLAQKRKIDRGVHPANGLPIAGSQETCGTCEHITHQRGTAGSYLKCALGSMSRGPASDIRAWWPACIAWEPKQ
jgi:hypothetical protein